MGTRREHLWLWVFHRGTMCSLSGLGCRSALWLGLSVGGERAALLQRCAVSFSMAIIGIPQLRAKRSTAEPTSTWPSGPMASQMAATPCPRAALRLGPPGGNQETAGVSNFGRDETWISVDALADLVDLL